MGLYLGQWFNGILWAEKLGSKLWPLIQPLSKRFMPIKSIKDALVVGMVWGWLPCGLVYWALLIAAAAGDPSVSASFMIIFGLATLPGMVATGMLAGWIQQIRRLPHANQIAGLLLIVLKQTEELRHSNEWQLSRRLVTNRVT